MPKFLSNSRMIIALGVASLLSIALYFHNQPATSPTDPVVIRQPPEKIEKKNPKVKLKVVVTACQKIKVTIPLDAGVITQSDDLRVVKGYVLNQGDLPVQYVKIQLYWQNTIGEFIDYDDIFAVTSKVLYPGERTNFQMSKRNILIQKCSAKLLDFWVVGDDEKPVAEGEA